MTDAQRVGLVIGQDGALMPLRSDKTGANVIVDGHGRYAEPALRGGIYSLYLNATTTTVAAGNIEAAAAGASTQFTIWNPRASDVILVLLKLGVGIISGTPTAGGMTHSLFSSLAVTATNTGTVYSHKFFGTGGGGSRAGFIASAAGAAITGGTALITLRMANFATTATAAASVNFVNAIEEIAGDIILMPGMGWVPTWRGAGTTLLNNYSITWEEVPL